MRFSLMVAVVGWVVLGEGSLGGAGAAGVAAWSAQDVGAPTAAIAPSVGPAR
jgi:hypothetical protein